MNAFLLGALAMAFLAAGMFFVRFYMRTHDRFFLFFSVALGIMSANQVALMALGEESEFRSLVYLFRLGAFLVILVAIYDKNRN